jgi:hypothetical protein
MHNSLGVELLAKSWAKAFPPRSFGGKPVVLQRQQRQCPHILQIIAHSKQQQLIEKSDGHEIGTKMTAGVHFVALMASATILAPSAPGLFDARFRHEVAL